MKYRATSRERSNSLHWRQNFGILSLEILRLFQAVHSWLSCQFCGRNGLKRIWWIVWYRRYYFLHTFIKTKRFTYIYFDRVLVKWNYRTFIILEAKAARISLHMITKRHLPLGSQKGKHEEMYVRYFHVWTELQSCICHLYTFCVNDRHSSTGARDAAWSQVNTFKNNSFSARTIPFFWQNCCVEQNNAFTTGQRKYRTHRQLGTSGKESYECLSSTCKDFIYGNIKFFNTKQRLLCV